MKTQNEKLNQLFAIKLKLQNHLLLIHVKSKKFVRLTKKKSK